MLQHRPLSLHDVVERPDGEVRCRPAFFQELWSQATLWRRAIAPWAEQVAAAITTSIPARRDGRPLQAPTPLTGLRRRQAVADRHGWVHLEVQPRRADQLPRTCLGCGGPVTSSQQRCTPCAQARRGELADRARQGPGEKAPNSTRITPSLTQLAAVLGLSEEATRGRLSQLGRHRLAKITGASPITTARWSSGSNVPQPRWGESLRVGICQATEETEPGAGP